MAHDFVHLNQVLLDLISQHIILLTIVLAVYLHIHILYLLLLHVDVIVIGRPHGIEELLTRDTGILGSPCKLA